MSNEVADEELVGAQDFNDENNSSFEWKIACSMDWGHLTI